MPAEQASAALEKFNIAAAAPVVISISRKSPHPNFDTYHRYKLISLGTLIQEREDCFQMNVCNMYN